MGNSASEEEEVEEKVIERDISEYQLSLHDGEKQAEVYIGLNGEVFAVTEDKEFIEKHKNWIAKNTTGVPKEDVAVYADKYKKVGNVIETRKFTVDELREFDGKKTNKIYLAAKGLVFDVTKGEDFYGEDGGYAMFAGRNAQRALALVSLKIEDVDNTDISDLTETNIETLDDWVKKYHSKYIHVGYLTQDATQDATADSDVVKDLKDLSLKE